MPELSKAQKDKLMKQKLDYMLMNAKRSKSPLKRHSKKHSKGKKRRRSKGKARC
jgi:hypothetical protein